jgi:two-component system OmpR family sensor kinase
MPYRPRQLAAHLADRARGAAQAVRRYPARTPLRVKLVVTLLVLVTCGLTVSGAVATTQLRGYLLDRVDLQLRDATGPGHVPEPGARRGPGPPSAFYVEYFDAAGNSAGVVSNRLGDADDVPALSPTVLHRAEQKPGQPFTVPSAGAGPDWRVIVRPTRMSAGTVAVATSLGEVGNTVGRLVQLEVVIGLAVLVLLGLLGYVLVRRNLRPLEEIEATAEAIAAGHLSRRVPDRDPRTEVGRLARALNGMLAQIETAFRVRAASEASARRSEERMRRFVTDASHELRTPLTSIRGFAELYRQGAAGRPADLARLMRRIEDEASRMGLLVDDLLLLARLDQQRPLQRDPVDLLTLAADAVHDARAVDPDRPVKLEVAGAGTAAVVLGDGARLRQVLGNLVGNALTHTPPGTPVTVRLLTREQAPAAAVVEVTDEGPGLEPEDAERAFERFYRADTSRTRASGGTGLGLSIVAALVAAHGGTVELDTGRGQGATFRVVLPLAAPPPDPDSGKGEAASAATGETAG